MGQIKRQLVIWSAIAVTTAVLPGLALADKPSPEHGGRREGRGHRHDDAKLTVAGRAISRGTTDSYGLQIRGSSDEQPGDAVGMVRFVHKGQDVKEGLVGEISCLSKDSAGVVSVSGTVRRSGKRDRAGTDKKAPKTPGAPSPTATDDDGAALLDELAPWDATGEAEFTEPARHGGRDGQGKGERGGRSRRDSGELAGKDFAFTISTTGKPQKFSQPTIGEKGTLAACSGGGTPTLEVTRGRFRVHEAGAEDAKDENKAEGERDDYQGRRWWRG